MDDKLRVPSLQRLHFGVKDWTAYDEESLKFGKALRQNLQMLLMHGTPVKGGKSDKYYVYSYFQVFMRIKLHKHTWISQLM